MFDHTTSYDRTSVPLLPGELEKVARVVTWILGRTLGHVVHALTELLDSRVVPGDNHRVIATFHVAMLQEHVCSQDRLSTLTCGSLAFHHAIAAWRSVQWLCFP